MSLPVLAAKLEALERDVRDLETWKGVKDERDRSTREQQAWILGVGTGIGAAGMLLVQLILQRVF